MKHLMSSGGQGFLQALGVSLYCTLVAAFMWNAEHIFGNGGETMIIPLAMLTLFSASVLISALIVFYKPYKLFFAGKSKEALDVVISTTFFLFLFVILFFTTLFLIK